MFKNLLFSLLIVFSNVASASISDIEFSNSTKLISSLYAKKIASRHNKKFVINIWNGNGKGFVQCYEKICEMVIFDGIKTVSTIGLREFQAFLCHEIGHLLGKKYINDSIHSLVRTSITSAEGESDYFSTNICMKEVLSGSLEKEVKDIFLKQSISDSTLKKCSQRYVGNKKELNKCIVSVVSAVKLLNVEVGVAENLDSRNLCLGTELNYPSTECRYSSIVAGALGLARPSCWYVANNQIPDSCKIKKP
jgi:hypothetical protein